MEITLHQSDSVCDVMTSWVDMRREVDVFYLDFSKPFDNDSYNILVTEKKPHFRPYRLMSLKYKLKMATQGIRSLLSYIDSCKIKKIKNNTHNLSLMINKNHLA